MGGFKLPFVVPKRLRLVLVMLAAAGLMTWGLDAVYECEDDGCTVGVQASCVRVAVAFLDDGVALDIGGVSGCDDPEPE